MQPIYLDYSATTPIDSRVLSSMMPFMQGAFGNPASTHHHGVVAKEAVEYSRAWVAELVNAKPHEIIWTSGATEANNLAIKGAAHAYKDRGRHLITVATEHKAVLDTFKELESQGFDITILPVQQDGMLDLSVLKAAIRKDTTFVSVMAVNNETGVRQDLQAISDICDQHRIIFHTDATQAPGHMMLDLEDLGGVSLASFSAHKAYGPKGIGALFVRSRPRTQLIAQMHGGGHERGFRSGTLPVHQIVGMGSAFAMLKQEGINEIVRLGALRDRLYEAIQDIPGLVVNGTMQSRSGHNLNVAFHGIKGDALLKALPELSLSNGSACTALNPDPSYVLRAMGVPDEVAITALRITVGRFTTDAEIDTAAYLINKRARELMDADHEVF